MFWGITKEQYDNLQQSQCLTLRDIDVELSKLTSSQETFYLTAETVLNLVSKAEELFKKATTSERQNILKLISYNSKANGREYALNLKNPFIYLFDFSKRPLWHELVDICITVDWGEVEHMTAETQKIANILTDFWSVDWMLGADNRTT